MFFNFSKNKYWTYLFLFFGFYFFINSDQFSMVWIISGAACIFLIFRWRAHALECAADELEKWELKEIIRIHDIPRKRAIKPVLKEKKKSRSGLEPLLEALQAPVLPLNDLDNKPNPNQLNIDIILDNKLFFAELRKNRKRRKIEKYPYLGDKEQLGKEFRYLAFLLFKYVFVPARFFLLIVCWIIVALSFYEFLTPDLPMLFVYNGIHYLIQDKLSVVIFLYFPQDMGIVVYKSLLIWAIIRPLKQVYLFVKAEILPLCKKLVEKVLLIIEIILITFDEK